MKNQIFIMMVAHIKDIIDIILIGFTYTANLQS
jgi:hypothetical protein